MKCYGCFVILLIIAVVLCHPVPSSPPAILQIPTSETFDFMKRYGYLEDTPNSEALYTEDAIRDVIKTVQKFGGISQTGIIDNATLTLMKSRRCGVPDIIRNSRNKRYVLGSRGWRKRHITYYLLNWTPKLGEQVVAENIQVALDTWGKYGRLTFTRVYDASADIIVVFARGPHGDSFPFDGPGEVLAHAFFPSEYHGRGGDIHFDEEEEWNIHTKESQKGTDFFTVAFHELGHSLGLSHSPVVTSIMFPYYQGFANDLDYDDILGMYALYIQGMPDSVPEFQPPIITPRIHTTTELYDYEDSNENNDDNETNDSNYNKNNSNENNDENNSNENNNENNSNERNGNEIPDTRETIENETEGSYDSNENDNNIPEPKPLIPEICEGNFDAIGTLREELFVFKGQYFWRLREKRQIEYGYPARIGQMFPLPEYVHSIDAVYERPDGMIVLFAGSKFWVYNGNSFVENSPQSLSRYGLPENLDQIDAVFNWPKNGKTYLFKHDRMWRYDENTQTLDTGYPMHIHRWRGVPENIDAVTVWSDGITYFFKGKLYWTFDDNWVSVTESSPLPAPQIWLGCPEKEFVREYFGKETNRNETSYYQLYGQT